MVESRKAFGGKTIYGASVGILMMDTAFPRVPGDMGNAASWPFPVLYKTVRGADRLFIHRMPRERVFAAFADAALELVADGADGIAVCCGMMSPYQADLAGRCGVPVMSSPLFQVPMVELLLPPGRRVGVLTISTNLLKPHHLEAAGVRPDTPVIGCADTDEFMTMRRPGAPGTDIAVQEAEIVGIAKRLVTDHPEVGALVLECTNMAPFSSAVRAATGLPIYDVYSFVAWFQGGLRPRDFGHPGSAPRPWRDGLRG